MQPWGPGRQRLRRPDGGRLAAGCAMSGAACLTVEASNCMDASLRKRILLVDDHLVVRESLVLLLAQAQVRGLLQELLLV